MPNAISIDTETTGLDLNHSCRPFFVTSCNELRDITFWEWDVNPFTRMPAVPQEDLDEIWGIVTRADIVVGHNQKYDIQALATLRPQFLTDWPWEKTYDTILTSHLLASNKPHNLTANCVMYLGRDIEPLEAALEVAVKAARALCRKHLPDWKIAKEGMPELPSAKGELWRNDYWLPRAICIEAERLDAEREEAGVDLDGQWWESFRFRNHPWHAVLRDYANADSAATILLFREHERHVAKRGLGKIAEVRRKLLPIVAGMESRGVTLSGDRLAEREQEFREDSQVANRICENIAAGLGYQLQLPKSGNNNSLLDFFPVLLGRDCDRLPKTPTGKIKLDKSSLEALEAGLPARSRALAFVRALRGKRKRDTACSYIEGYKRFMLPYINLTEDSNAQAPEESQHLISARDQDSMEVPKEGGQERGVLDVDRRDVQQRVRTIPRARGNEGASSKLSTASGGNPGESVRVPSVRQPSVCEPRSPISGDDAGQHAGHDRERPRRQGKRDASSGGESNRRSSAGDSTPVRDRKIQTAAIVRDVQSKPSASPRDYPPEVLEAYLATSKFFVLHPSLNPTGTATLRWSSSQPNEQNISKVQDVNLRYCFGPAPGREWWSLDYDNVELRIPAYESGEQAMIEIFEKPDEPPYFGSYHLMNASIIYPDLFWPLADKKGAFKEKYKSTWYQWVKNFGFACSYGAIESSGTADRAAHKPGAQRLVMNKLKEHTKLNQRMIDFANRYGYVETIPDKEVDPQRGYPLLCTRTENGRVLPTVPLNFHVQGSACWVMLRAMISVQEYFNELNAAGGDYHITMNVHDELVLDFPFAPDKGNLPIIREVRRRMESMGDCINVPLTCGVDYHINNWGEGEKI